MTEVKKIACHWWSSEWTGKMVAAQPGFEFVSIGISDNPGGGDAGSDYWVWREPIQAWGVFREVMVNSINGSIVRICPKCQRADDEGESYQARPMTVGDSFELVDIVTEYKNGHNTGVLGVYAKGETIDQAQIDRLAKTIRERMAKGA